MVCLVTCVIILDNHGLILDPLNGTMCRVQKSGLNNAYSPLGVPVPHKQQLFIELASSTYRTKGTAIDCKSERTTLYTKVSKQAWFWIVLP